LLAYQLVKLPAHWKALRQAIQDSGAQIVHLNESNLVPAAMMAKRLGSKVVWHVRHFLADGWQRALIHHWMRQYADAVIAINEDVRRCLAGLPHVYVIYNSIDLNEYASNDRGSMVRARLGISGNTLCVGHTGGIHWAKGIFDFIEAVRLLHSYFPLVQFLITRNSPYSPKLFHGMSGRLTRLLKLHQDYESQARQMVIQYSLQDVVHFVGFFEDLPALYSALDIVVYPSRLKTIGRPALEAAACGKPVIATSDTGNSDVVVDGVTGLLVPPADPPALAAAIKRLLNDPDLRQRLGKAGLEWARARFDYQVNGRLVMQLYDQILGK
jgi:glycosyltransferase involved in cell wall biosynthesis